MLISNKRQHPEYIKIRSHVIKEIIRAGERPTRLKPTRELAKSFGVSLPTVLKALKELISDGYLIVKPGRLGIFTCPSRLKMRDNIKSVGLLYGDGKKVYIMLPDWQMGSAFATAIMKASSSHLIQNVFLSESREKAAQEIAEMNLDVVVWVLPTKDVYKTILDLKEKGQKQLSAGRFIEGIDCAFLDVENEYRMATGAILDEGRKRSSLILHEPIGSGNDHVEQAVLGWRKAYEERGLEPDEDLLLALSPSLEKNFEKTLESLKPDGICFFTHIEPFYCRLRQALDIETQCRLYSNADNLYGNMGPYTGYVGSWRVDEAARVATPWLVNQTSSIEGDIEPLKIKISVDIAMRRG